MGFTIVKRSVSIAGHRTSISLEEPFWQGLREIAERDKLSIQALIGRIDAERGEQNLSSAIRVFVLDDLRQPLEHIAVDQHDSALGANRRHSVTDRIFVKCTPADWPCSDMSGDHPALPLSPHPEGIASKQSVSKDRGRFQCSLDLLRDADFVCSSG